MNGLRRLIHEIHRRSLWQVTGIFLAASWGVLQVVELLTETAGLPDWTPSMALVLLLLGLPVCLATAFVQEGMPGQDQDRGTGVGQGRADASAGAGAVSLAEGAGAVNLAPGTGSLDRPSTRVSGSRRLFTWRNAVLGGVGAFALLGVTLVAYFAMWATGIGPVGNLVAQGLLDTGDQVVLADFEDRTGEGLGDAVTEALRVDLTGAGILQLVPDVDVAETLARMQVGTEVELSADLAREVALRDGYEALLEGEVSAVGTGYMVTATLRAASNGRSIASFRVGAEGPDRLIAAIDKLSQDIREKSGESLRTIKGDAPLEQVTTRSLDALRRYSEAVRDFGSGDWDTTIGLLEEAVEIDPAFAMAWRKLAAAYQNTLTDPARELESATRAFEHRDRLTQKERYLAEAYYYQLQGDTEAALVAYENVLRIDPTDGAALNNAAIRYSELGDLDRAEEYYRRAVRTSTASRTALSNLTLNRMAVGAVDEAAQVVVEWETAFPQATASRRLAEFFIALERDDFGTAAAILEAIEESPDLAPFERAEAAMLGAVMALRTGRLEDARRLRARAVELGGVASPARAWFQRMVAAFVEILFGDAEAAVRDLEAAITDGTLERLPPQARQASLLATVFATAGRPDRVDQIAAEWARTATPTALQGSQATYLAIQARVARTVAGDHAGAVQEMQRLRTEAGCRGDHCFRWEHALVAEAAGDAALAIELYEQMVRTGEVIWPWNGFIDVYALTRLGPLHEAAGNRAEAIAVYQRVIELWSGGDATGRRVVQQYQSRIDALIEGSG